MKLGTRHLQRLIEDQSIPVTESGCWIWISASDKMGYGTRRIGSKGNNKNYFAHRLSAMAFLKGFSEDKQVLHKCDNPSCVNPNHLFLGRHKDNMADMARKKRNRVPRPNLRGERHFNHRLTEKDVRAIRAEFEPWVVTHKMLGEKYGISPRTARAITDRKLWTHVED